MRRIVEPSPIRLPESTGIRREPPRPAELRQADYLDRFDASTLIYDAFCEGDQVRLVGPPLLNLTDSIADAEWRIDGVRVPARLRDQDRAQSSILVATATGGETLTVGIDGAEVSSQVSESGIDWFRGRRTLLAVSSGTNPSTVADWATFHRANHDVDAVLLYVDTADAESLAALLEALDVPGIETAVVVSWTFAPGPPGGPKRPWDSNFAELGALEHARHRFLSSAAGVACLDVAEYVLAADGQSIFTHLAQAPSGALRFRGRRIEPISAQITAAGHRCLDFRYYDPASAPNPRRWAMSPKSASDVRQWMPHNVTGTHSVETRALSYRRIAGLKPAGNKPTVLDLGRHRIDLPLASSLQDVFDDERLGRVLRDNLPSASEHLGHLADLLDVERWAADGLKHVRVTPKGVIVCAYRTPDNLSYTFRLTSTSDGFLLDLGSTEDAGWDLVQERCGPMGTPLEGVRRLELQRWTSDVPPETVAVEARALISAATAEINRPNLRQRARRSFGAVKRRARGLLGS